MIDTIYYCHIGLLIYPTAGKCFCIGKYQLVRWTKMSVCLKFLLLTPVIVAIKNDKTWNYIYIILFVWVEQYIKEVQLETHIFNFSWQHQMVEMEYLPISNNLTQVKIQARLNYFSAFLLTFYSSQCNWFCIRIRQIKVHGISKTFLFHI